MTSEVSSSPSPLSQADLSRIAQDLQVRKVQVDNAVQLLDEGNTIPFITRYRKERTGGLNEVVLRLIFERMQQIRQLADRKRTILRTIESQGKLTEELKAAIEAADHSRRLEDLYLPFKPKKKTLASDARDKGLEPFAAAIWSRDPALANFDEFVAGMVNPEKGLSSPDDVLLGAKHILAEIIAETADMRGAVRRVLWDHAKFAVTKNEKLPDGKGLEYKDYFHYTEPVLRVPPHRVLAINRGERENALTVRLEYDLELIRKEALASLPSIDDHPHRDFLLTVIEDSLNRLVVPSLEREIRRDLTDRAVRHAVEVFARNLRGLLLQPPLRGKRILAIDPGFRTGCKLAALDEHGNMLEDAVVHPHPPQRKKAEAKLQLERLIRKHQTPVIAIGNGTACRETEEVVANLIGIFEKRRRGEPIEETPDEAPAAATSSSDSANETPIVATTPEPPKINDGGIDLAKVTFSDPNAPSPPVVAEPPAAEAAPVAAAEAVPAKSEKPIGPDPAELQRIADLKAEVSALPEPPTDLVYVIVNEAGASDYSASPIGREEFPNLDATLRGTISIGRRLQDPLSELVKIDPQHVGVGLYQHDVQGKHLKGSLESIIESCVNHVGVDVNSASVPLLRHVAGFNQLVARELFDYRQKNGPFRSRQQLAEVPSIGPVRYIQAAGFLKIADGDEPFDRTWIHPESYPLARQILQELGHAPEDLGDKTKHEELRAKLNSVNIHDIAQKFSAGLPTIDDIFFALARPGRDPRDELPPPIFRRDVLKLEDLKPGMELKGTVLNVVDFGAFVDIGLKDSGLVHISQLANRYIRSPHEVVTVGDVVVVWVMSIDNERRRVSLTMLDPVGERKAEEKPAPRSFGGRQRRDGDERGPRQQGGRPQRGDRRGPPNRRRGPDDGQGQLDAQTSDGKSPQRSHRAFRKPQPPKPLPTLTKEKKEGKAYLTTLGELEAYFKNRDSAPPPPQSE